MIIKGLILLKVLLQNRANYFNNLAGDTVQLLKTKEYLQKLEVEVVVSSDYEVDLRDYDLVHLFNLFPVEATYQFYRNAVRQDKKVVLSPIFWDPTDFYKACGEFTSFQKWWQQTQGMRREIITGSSMLFPGSYIELLLLEEMFVHLPPSVIVPNGVENFFAKGGPDYFRNKYQYDHKTFVLSVGRITPQKNQLSLIKALQKLEFPLLIVGPVNDGNYYLKCRKVADPRKVRFLDTVNQTMLSSIYAAANVHALVSYYDLPGLVSLEAAAAGCQIVSTECGAAREYFGNLAFYCNPKEPESISAAVVKAWRATPNNRLKNHVLTNYNWEKIASIIKNAYQELLN